MSLAQPTQNAGILYSSNNNPQLNANNAAQSQTTNYNQFMTNLPQYQANMNNATIDQGNQNYNAQKQNIDQSANQRGLLYSGLKTGAETSAANTAANQTQNQIAQNNQNLSNYATGVGNQVTQGNAANYQAYTNQALQQYGSALQSQGQNAGLTGSLVGGAMGLGGLALFSDKKLKDDVEDGDKDTKGFLDSMDAKKFSYKDDPDKKKQIGILAQDLEKHPMGKAIVIETPKGKAIDMGKALSAILAAQSVIHKRLNRISA